MISETGPFLQMAVICQHVLEEKDGVLSAIRVVDRFTIDGGPSDPPEMKPTTVLLTALIVLKAGEATGSATVSLQPEGPDGIKRPRIELPVLFEGQDRGVALHLNLALDVRQAGLYWIDVRVDGQLFTRMPVRILYRQVRIGT